MTGPAARAFLSMLLTATAILTATAAAPAGTPGALVTDVSGEVRPAVDLFDEVGIGTELELGAGARLTLEHYASCEAVTMVGGSVVVRETGLDLARAAVAGRAELPCAHAVTLSPEDEITASVVLRGSGLPRVPLVPEIVVAGGGAGYDLLRIERRGGREVATLRVRAGRAEWPEGRLFLTDRTAYVLVLSGPAGEHRADVLADRGGGGRTVLRP